MQTDLFRNPFPTMEQFLTEENRKWIESALDMAQANGFHDNEVEEVALKDVLSSMQPYIVNASMNSEERAINITSHLASLTRSYFLTLKLQERGNTSNGEIDFTNVGVKEIIKAELQKAYEEYIRDRTVRETTFEQERSKFTTIAKSDNILSTEVINFLGVLSQSQFHNFLIALTRGGYQDHPTDPSMKLYIDDLHRRVQQSLLSNGVMDDFLHGVQNLASEKFGLQAGGPSQPETPERDAYGRTNAEIFAEGMGW
eukprot:6205034-Pleurochrysis_carterae.AAC.2